MFGLGSVGGAEDVGGGELSDDVFEAVGGEVGGVCDLIEGEWSFSGGE